MGEGMEKDAEEVPTDPSRFEMYCEKMGINPNLLMLKITLFMCYGAAAALLPFLTIHMQSIGLTVEEIAIIYLALPLTTFLSPPITGFLVDKFGQYKGVLIMALVLNGVFHQSLMMIPQMEIPGEVPEAYVLRHPETGKVEVWWSPCPSRECPEDEEINMVLDDCYDYCNSSLKKAPGLLEGIHESIAVRPPSFLSPANCPGYPGVPANQPNPPSFGILPEDLKFSLEKKKNFTTTRKPKRLRREDDKSKNDTLEVVLNVTEDSQEAALFILDMHPDLQGASEHLGFEASSEENDTQTDFREHFSNELLFSHGVNYTELEESDLRCGGFVMATNMTMNTLREMASDCILLKCRFREGGPEVCPPNYKESDDRVFWIYFVLRFLGTTMMSAGVTVLDPIALTMVQQYGGEFGRERLFSTLGMAVFSPLSGYLIDISSRRLGYTDYSAAFYTYTTLLGISAFCVLLMPVGAKMPADDLLKDMVKLLRLPHIIIFIFFVFCLGNCWGFIESYLFLYLKELGAPNYLLGVTVTVGTLSSVPFLYGAEDLCRKIGHVNIIIIAFFTHSARLVGYSYIEDALWCFPFEAMEAVSVHLMWVAAATYCSLISPKNLLATLIGILGMAHYSLGRGSGSFSGGILIGNVGIRQSFRLMGLMSVICGIIYALLYFFWLHKYSDKKKKGVKPGDAAEAEKLRSEEEDDKDTMGEKENLERLSLMIRFNHRGSLSSLSADHMRGGSRRNSSTSELTRNMGKMSDAGLRPSLRSPSVPLVRASKVGEVVSPKQTRKSIVAKSVESSMEEIRNRR